jgi:hypothetical protein
MNVIFTNHARQRMRERGATAAQVRATVRSGRSYLAKLGRTRFAMTFAFDSTWLGTYYRRKRVEVLATPKRSDWLAVTVVVKYF